MPEYTYAVHGLAASLGRGFSLEAAAVRLADAIGELRADGELPARLHTHTDIDPQRRTLTLRGRGLAPDDDPDRTEARNVLHTLFQLASFHNIVPLDESTPPLFTVRIVLLDRHDRPFAALVGAGMGEAEPLPAGAPWNTTTSTTP